MEIFKNAGWLKEEWADERKWEIYMEQREREKIRKGWR